MQRPLVSIVIPVYNGSNYLKRAIDSALDQTYKNIEIIVVNDGSNDEGKTEQIALSYGNRIRYFSKKNGGVASALNLGIQKMKGKYFSWLSHDDEYMPNKIEIQINFIKKNSKQSFIVFSNYSIINEKSRKICEAKSISKNLLNIEYLSFGHINMCSMLIYKTVFSKIGNFDEKYLSTQDYEFLFKAIEHFEIFHIPQSLLKSRQHNKQCSKLDSKHLNEANNFYIKLIKKVDSYNFKTNKERQLYLIKLNVFLHKMKYHKAVSYLEDKFKLNKFHYLIRFYFYSYIDTTWCYFFGLSTIISQPENIFYKLYEKFNRCLSH